MPTDVVCQNIKIAKREKYAALAAGWLAAAAQRARSSKLLYSSDERRTAAELLCISSCSLLSQGLTAYIYLDKGQNHTKPRQTKKMHQHKRAKASKQAEHAAPGEARRAHTHTNKLLYAAIIKSILVSACKCARPSQTTPPPPGAPLLLFAGETHARTHARRKGRLCIAAVFSFV